ncbi:EF-hand calcium-binding domain-containing protein 7-like isoform X1 [Biomphalaria pfeifferi]|uniref:EF-hand calcium-binding domain-containing protein 7-like isoform X1 n=1 Tax=Biomphalaria pfeifferi TaxID=112525 RepID=A0AAD8AY45_BIOPF|nr:EF-hand calcium-binding domain-containing protein 7-like isoform X1 [Biomphalaria pfeifferi]
MSRRSSRSSTASSRPRTAGQPSRDIYLECQAAFLGHYDDLGDKIDSKEDLILLLQQTGRNPTSKSVAKYWTPRTESMTFEDFVDVCSREPVTSEEELLKAFHKIDLNGDGYISLDELYKIMTTKGEKMSKDEVKDIIDEVDENKDGKLDYKEFAKMVLSTTEEYKKLALRNLEKREKNRKLHGEITPRKDKDELSLGSQMSVGSSASDWRQSSPEVSPAPSPDRRLSMHSARNASQERRLSKQSVLDETSALSKRRSSTLSHMSNDDYSKPSPRVSTNSISKGGRSKEPTNLKDWPMVQSKGTFFLEDSSIISHVYTLNLTEDSDVWISIQPLKIGESGEALDGTFIDTALFVIDEDDNSFVAFTETKDIRGKYGLRCNMTKGKYLLIPFTTGCRLKPKKETAMKEAKLIMKEKGDKIVLTRGFKKALEDIFEMADLDGNRLLSREEFNWYNMRTSGEEVADDEWSVVEDNIELDKGQITLAGFIKLNEMEAEDNEGDTEDLWITLSAMGFNKSLLLDEACPFLLKVYTQKCSDPELEVSALKSNKDTLDKASCQLALTKGEAKKVKAIKDVMIYQYINDHRALIVVENKSKTKIKMSLDCNKTRNGVSHTGSMIATVIVPAQTSVVGHHILPLNDGSDLNVICEESVLK